MDVWSTTLRPVLGPGNTVGWISSDEKEEERRESFGNVVFFSCLSCLYLLLHSFLSLYSACTVSVSCCSQMTEPSRTILLFFSILRCETTLPAHLHNTTVWKQNCTGHWRMREVEPVAIAEPLHTTHTQKYPSFKTQWRPASGKHLASKQSLQSWQLGYGYTNQNQHERANRHPLSWVFGWQWCALTRGGGRNRAETASLAEGDGLTWLPPAPHTHRHTIKAKKS